MEYIQTFQDSGAPFLVFNDVVMTSLLLLNII